MNPIVNTVQPADELAIDVRERTKRATKEEIAFHKANCILDLAFGLRAIGPVKPWNKAIMPEKLFELGIPIGVG